MSVEQRLERLREASRALVDEPTIVRLVAQALSEACPRGLGLVYTIRGHPARAVGAAAGLSESAEIDAPDLDRFRRVYGSAQLYYDRASVQRDQRERWMELPQDWFRSSQFYPIFRPYGRMARMLVCLGSRPLACMGLLRPERGALLSAQEEERLRLAVERSVGPLRVVALLAQAEAALDGVEHLLGRHAEAAYLLARSGAILSCSPAGQQALARHPGLAELLARTVSASHDRARSVTSPLDGLEVHVTPCAPRGAAAGYLATLGSARVPGRDRLTPREAELVGWLEQGLTNAGIARRMGLAEPTVKTMLERLYRKAGAHGRVALLRFLRTAGEPEQQPQEPHGNSNSHEKAP